MKQCPKCQASISDTAKFCMECGCNIKKYEEEHSQPKVRFCPECGTEIPRGSFCPECGYNIGNDLNKNATVSDTDTFGDGWLSDLESSTNADVASRIVEKAQMEKKMALDAFEYEVHADGSYTIVALKDKHALNIIIPEGVVSIGSGAFAGSEVMSVTLPDGLLKIGDEAFKGCSDLTMINLPPSLHYIGNEAFMDCEMLYILNVDIPGNIYRIGKDALKNTAGEKRRLRALAEEEERKKEEQHQKELADSIRKKEIEQKKAEEELKQAKADAVAELNAYVDKTKYRKAQAAEIDKILKDIISTINGTKVLLRVRVLTNDGKKALDKIKTDAVMTAEEKQRAEAAEKKRKAEEDAKRKAKEAAEKKQREEAEARLRAEYQALFDQQEKDRLSHARYQCEQLKKKELNTLSLGLWPQSEAAQNVLIENLQDENGYYFGKDVNGNATKFAKINGKYYKVEPILWGRFGYGFLDSFISVRTLDCMRYDKSSGNYGQSEILAWLNGEFYQKAFTDWEKRMLMPSLVPNMVVDLPNYYDMDKLDNPTKIPSAYAKARGAATNSENGKGGYWLHCYQYENTQEALEMDHNGVVYRSDVRRHDLGVAPYITVTPHKII